MNTVVTSKEEILNQGIQLALESGWRSFNIRALAKRANISVGTIYNYFGSKSELISAIVESIWGSTFSFPKDKGQIQDFASLVDWACSSLESLEEKYPGFLFLHSSLFKDEELLLAKQKMGDELKRLHNIFYEVLISDVNVSKDAFDDEFTPECFIRLVISLFMSSIITGNINKGDLIHMIRRVAYIK